MTDYDVIVVGGGHNGLVCASYLGKAGYRVLVLEANETAGGAASTREFAPGYFVSGCAQWLQQLNPELLTELDLRGHGLHYAARDLDSIGLSAAGQHVVIGADGVIGDGLSDQDKAAYLLFQTRMIKFASLLDRVFARRPPKLVEPDWHDRLNLMRLALDTKRLGKLDMQELFRVALMNIYDLLNEHFDDELLKGVLSVDGVLGTQMGPRSPNTVFAFLYRRLAEVHGYKGPAQVLGGMGKLAEVLALAAKANGVDIRMASPVAAINAKAGRALGVTLVDGEQLSAAIIVSNADPKTTLQQLLGFQHIETGTARRVSNIRMNGTAAKLHLALDGLPNFQGLNEADLGQRLLIAPDMKYVENAFNHAKYGEFSTAPIMDISIATVNDPGLAPPGKHVLSAIVQYAPHQLRDGWENARDDFKAICIDTLSRYAADLPSLVTASELLTPQDLEREYRLGGGHWHHGEISLDQVLMMRPFFGASQYATPVDGLYLCGAGTHPGGGLMGTAGRNAAREIIRSGGAA